MLRLVAPVLAMNVLHVMVEYVDTWLTGNYLEGDAPLAAINQIRYVMWMVFNLFAVVSIGATAMVARFVGAGDRRQAGRVTHQAILLGIVIALVMMVVGHLFLERFVMLLRLEGEAAKLAVRYLRIVLPFLPLIMLEEVGIACLRGAGDTVSGLWAVAVVNLVNVVLSSCLLLGLGPFSALGWDGLAIGTACARLVGGLIVVWLLVRGRAGLRLRFRLLRPIRDLMRRLLRIGVPGGADAISVILCHLWFVSIINQLGPRAAAAHAVAVSIEALAYMQGAAFQIAAATMVGQYLGAGQHDRAGRSVLMACGVGGGLMTAAGVFFFVGAEPLAGFFLGESNAQVIPISGQLLRIVSFAMPPLALSMVLTGALRGAGDTRWPLAITFVGFLGVRIPLAYLLAQDSVDVPLLGPISGWGLGVVGAWYAMVADVWVRCLLVVVRFAHGGWKRTEV